MGEPKSETEKDTNLVERFSGGEHYKTTITSEDGTRYVGEGNTAKESEERASDRYHNRK